MWKQTCLLAGVQLRNLWGWNQIVYGKDVKKKRRLILMMVSFIIIGVMFAFYSAISSYGMIVIGVGRLVPAALFSIISIIILFFSMFKAGSIIFEVKTYETMITLPVSPAAIVLSRFANMYIQNLLMGFVFMLPAAVVYLILLQPSVTFYIGMLVGTILMPLIPMALATVVGGIIVAISSRMKHKNLIAIILSMGITIAILVGTMALPNAGTNIELTEDVLLDIGVMVEQQIYGIYPVSKLFTEAVVDGNWISLLSFTVLNLGIFGILVALVQWKFVAICNALYSKAGGEKYEMQELTQKKVIGALYTKELARYFSSSIYVLNTAIGYVMVILLAIGILVYGLDNLEVSMGMTGILTKALPFVLVFCIGISSTTNCSISMEGKQWWLTKSLPVSTKDVFDAKMLVNLTIAIPSYVITIILLFIAIKPSFIEGLWYLLIPLVYILFSTVVGITINCKMPLLNWEAETEAVKQGGSTFIAMLVNFFFGLLPAILIFVLPSFTNLVFGGTVVVMFILVVYLYINNQKINLQEVV